MAQDAEKTRQLFETRARQLILAFQELKEKNRNLLNELKERDETIDRLTAEKEALQKQYDSLKLAKMIEINDNDMRNAKSRINKLVREIDKCIALLNV